MLESNETCSRGWYFITKHHACWSIVRYLPGKQVFIVLIAWPEGLFLTKMPEIELMCIKILSYCPYLWYLPPFLPNTFHLQCFITNILACVLKIILHWAFNSAWHTMWESVQDTLIVLLQNDDICHTVRWGSFSLMALLSTWWFV